MKRIQESEIPLKVIEGEIGSVDAFDIIDEKFLAGVRIVKPNSDVPKRIHKHPERQILYVIEGTAEITNGKETMQLTAGDFIILKANEEHYIVTKGTELKVFEIKFH